MGTDAPRGRKAAGVNRRDASLFLTGDMEHPDAAARQSRETFGKLAGHDGTISESLIEADAVVATEAVTGAWEASLATPETEARDAVGAEQEAVGRCRKTRRGRRKRRHGNCIFGALRSDAGLHSPRRRTADRPAKLNRTPARGR